MTTEQAIEAALEAAREAGNTLAKRHGENPEVLSETGKDIKTRADLAAEEVILNSLRNTGIPILSEETGCSAPLSLTDRMWIIDPLDGTFNFVRGFPVCCVSIALWNGMHPEFGVIHDFVQGHTYLGRGQSGGACNGKPLQVSSCAEVHRAVLSTGFPAGGDFGTGALTEFVDRVQRFKKIRMIGSAAMSLAHVAAGHFDAYYEENIWLWDVAAGLALVRASGGDFTISKINPNFQVNVFAHNGRLPMAI